ncbi:MAG: hypothetical protein M0Z78_08780 [Betaproteobacteria bacterium]|nr:hypothetical protein [Betaproteobacteria bacterium]
MDAQTKMWLVAMLVIYLVAGSIEARDNEHRIPITEAEIQVMANR